jgi:exodeoxyribonuclease VII small subunit
MTRNISNDAALPDFEKSLQELESLVATLERGDLPLAESLTLFEQGVALTRACHDALAQAQQKVSILLQPGGAEPQPFEASPEPGNE